MICTDNRNNNFRKTRETYWILNLIKRGKKMQVFDSALMATVFVGLAVISQAMQPTSWIGQEVLPASSKVKFNKGINNALGGRYLSPMPMKVLQETNGRLKLEFFDQAIWIDKSDAVLFTEAVGFFTQQIAKNNKDADALILRAAALAEKQSFEKALDDLNEATRVDSKNSKAYWVRGRLLAARNSVGEAIDELSKAIQLDPDNPDCYLVRALLLSHKATKGGLANEFVKEDLIKASQDLSKAIKSDPTFSMAFGLRGLVRNSLGDYDKAIVDLSDAIGIDPLMPDFYLHRGIANANRGDFAKAIADFTDGIRLRDRKDYRDYFNRGVAYGAKNEFQPAIDDFTQAISLKDPGDKRPTAIAYSFRGGMYFNKKAYTSAIADFNEAIILEPSFETVRLSRAKSYMALLDYPKALAECNEILRLNPKSADGYVCRSTVYTALKKYKEAINDCNEAIKCDDNHTYAHRNLAAVLATCNVAELRSSEIAIRHATKACELTHWKSGLDLAVLAAAYAEGGQFDAAIKWQKKAQEHSDYVQFIKELGINPLTLFESKKPLRDS